VRVAPYVYGKRLISPALGLVRKRYGCVVNDPVVKQPIDEFTDFVALLKHLLGHDKDVRSLLKTEVPKNIDPAHQSILVSTFRVLLELFNSPFEVRSAQDANLVLADLVVTV